MKNTDTDVIERIFQELEHAEERHPGWPDDDVIHGAVLVGETDVIIMYGYRIFRDDLLLAEYETRVQCSRCGLWIYPDEVHDQYGVKLCPKCNSLIRSRIAALEDCNRTKCPIDSADWIFTSRYHRAHKRVITS